MKKILLAVIAVLMLSANVYSQLPFSVDARVGTNATFGKFNEIYKNGLSWELGVYYSTPLPGLDVSLTLGSSSFKYKNDYFASQISSNFPGVTLTDFNNDWNATDMPIMVGAKFMMPVGTTKTYITGEVGVHMVNFSDRFNGQQINGSSSTQMTIQLAGNTESKTESAVGYAIGGGMEIPIVPKVALDIALKYNYSGIVYSKAYTVFRNSSDQFTTSELKNISFLTAGFGVVVHL